MEIRGWQLGFECLGFSDTEWASLVVQCEEARVAFNPDELGLYCLVRQRSLRVIFHEEVARIFRMRPSSQGKQLGLIKNA